MAIAEIQAWIDKKGTYWDGVDLYEKYGTDPFYKKHFRKQYSRYNLELLRKLLLSLSVEPRKVSGEEVRVNFEHYPPEIKEMIQKKGDLVKLKVHLQNRMGTVRLPGRIKVLMDIVDLANQIDKIWKAIDHYHTTGKLLEEDKPAPVVEEKEEKMTQAQAIRKRDNLRSQISKGKKKQDPRVEEWQMKLEKLDARLKNWK